jgi:CelD/BcsL family acetyltransferase involved in cellulose biosynthesis
MASRGGIVTTDPRAERQPEVPAAGPGAVVTVASRHDPRWSELVARRPSDVFHSPAWHQVLHDAYGFEPQGRLLLGEDGAPLAGWAACRVEDLRGPRVVGLPFSDYGDPLVDDTAQWRCLTAGLGRDAPVRTRCLRSTAPLEDDDFAVVGRARWHGVDLTTAEEERWAALDPSARRAIRKAEREGVTVRAGSEATDVRAFFELHLQVRKRKYGMLAQPYRFFQAIHARFLAVGQGTLLLAEQGGQTLAGVLLLRWRDRLYYKFNASRADDLGVRPNDLLMWHAIAYGRARGLTLLDLGLSDWDQEGLVRYKRKYAGEERTITFLERPAVVPSAPDAATAATHGEATAAELRRLLPALTALFTDPTVPDAVTERAGDLLYGYFT